MASARRIAIYTYDPVSEGGIELRKALQIKIGGDVQWLDSSTRDTVNCSHVLCWGNVKEPLFLLQSGRLFQDPKILNKWGTGIKANKLKAFKAMKTAGVRTVPWTSSTKQAQLWLSGGHVVFERASLSGDNSKGITILQKKERTVLGNLSRNPQVDEHVKLFTQYVKHTEEYRIHTTPDHVFDGMAKRRTDKCKPFIFDSEHGLFCRDGVIIPQDVKEQAKAAIKAVDLDFGAVDLVWCVKKKKAYVLEVNSAPGLLLSEARSYAKGFIKHGYL